PSVPAGVLRAVAVGVELGARITGRSAVLTRDKLEDVSQPHQTCDAARARRELGWSPQHELERGSSDAYADYRRRGWL
ncbi:MAG: hypothetical protein M3Y87_27765, partial [Myxococcota bacterium]|nr:hypothetical protein [Myxococcota bacterium]